jgi:hypothetical protein
MSILDCINDYVSINIYKSETSFKSGKRGALYWDISKNLKQKMFHDKYIWNIFSSKLIQTFLQMDKISFYRWIVWWSRLARLLLHRPHCLRHLRLHHAQLTSFLQGIHCKKNWACWKSFWAKTFVALPLESTCPSYLSHFKWHNTNRMISFCVLLTKVNRCTKYHGFLCQSIFCWIFRLAKNCSIFV